MSSSSSTSRHSTIAAHSNYNVIDLIACRCVIRGCVPKKLLVYGYAAERLLVPSYCKSPAQPSQIHRKMYFTNFALPLTDLHSQRSSRTPRDLAGQWMKDRPLIGKNLLQKRSIPPASSWLTFCHSEWLVIDLSFLDNFRMSTLCLTSA